MKISGNYVGMAADGEIIPCGTTGIQLGGFVTESIIEDNMVFANEVGIDVKDRVVVRQAGPVHFIPSDIAVHGNHVGVVDSKQDSRHPRLGWHSHSEWTQH